MAIEDKNQPAKPVQQPAQQVKAQPEKEVQPEKEMPEENEADFINPFDEGVTYEDFLEAIPEGVKVQDYCKDKLTEEQIAWLVQDLKEYLKED